MALRVFRYFLVFRVLMSLEIKRFKGSHGFSSCFENALGISWFFGFLKRQTIKKRTLKPFEINDLSFCYN